MPEIVEDARRRNCRPRQGRRIVAGAIRRLRIAGIALLVAGGAGGALDATAQERRFAWQEVGGWIPFRTVCESTDMLGAADLDCRVARAIMTDVGAITWAGVVTDLNYDPATGTFDRVRLEVVMRNSSSDYRCGAIVEREIAGLRDLPGLPLGISVCPTAGLR